MKACVVNGAGLLFLIRLGIDCSSAVNYTAGLVSGGALYLYGDDVDAVEFLMAHVGSVVAQ